MAEERIEILVTSERTMLDNSNIRNSTGKTSTSINRKKILPPHYLRASTGSCHDFCKYGRKHAVEAKGKHYIPRRVTTTMAKGEDSVNSAIVSERKKKTATKLRPFLYSKTQSPNNSEINSEIIKQEAPSSGKKKEVSPKQVWSPAKQIDVSLRQASASAKKIEVSPKQALSPAKKIEVSPKEVSPKQAVSPAKKIEVSPKQAVSPARKIEVFRKQALSLAKKIEVSQKQALSPDKKIEASSKQAPSLAKKIEVSQKQALSPAKKIEVCPKQALSPAKKIEVSRKQALSPAKKIEVCPKQVLLPAKKFEASTKQNVSPAKRSNASANPEGSSEPKFIVAKPSSPSGFSGGIGGKRNGDLKTVKKMGTSRIDEKKMLRTPMASVSPKPSVLNTRTYRNIKAVSPLKSQNKVKKVDPMLSIEVQEKTLYVIEQPESKSLEPAQNGSHTNQSLPSSSSSSLSSPLNSLSFQSSPLLSVLIETDDPISEFDEAENEESESMLSEADDPISEYDETEDENQVETSNVEDKKPRRGSSCPENTDCLPRKLNFNKGQVVNLQSDNNSPRRLRFRRGRVIGENDGKVDIARKSLKRREVTHGDTYSTEPVSEKVILRHQDVQGKKDAQGLFNNVIEETASKLVETRKSKVKALVGAFETVISLQDGKPSTD
ncbi:neurofilament heavy polypeptide-like [Telopea speciosissima]|uniref:neurofilament heavy polypeptide-like n=1 Tax=Telopea speciosissima TaxID=54955 RepID=UPI001CC4AF70|nr:neurofilament heavy polypeptide-like [Telopea speciosissima]